MKNFWGDNVAAAGACGTPTNRRPPGVFSALRQAGIPAGWGEMMGAGELYLGGNLLLLALWLWLTVPRTRGEARYVPWNRLWGHPYDNVPLRLVPDRLTKETK